MPSRTAGTTPAWSAQTRARHRSGAPSPVIIDLSAADAPPFVFTDVHILIVVDGEIYDYSDLRHALESAGGPTLWRGHSDTQRRPRNYPDWDLAQALRES